MKMSVRIAAGVLIALTVTAVSAPLIVSIFGLPPPNLRDTSALSAVFGTPTGPDPSHPLGVDSLGRDILSRVIHGARIALIVSLPAAALTLLLGVTFGLVAGYRGGLADSVISRFTEVMLAVPFLLLAVGVAASCSAGDGCLGGSLRPGIPLIIVIFVFVAWPFVTRVVRNQTRSIRQSDYVAAAAASGRSELRILVGEVLPNLSGTVTVFLAVLVPQAILTEAALTFLGVGLSTSTPSWGAMISGGSPVFPEAWWYMLFPGLALLATVIAFAVIADHVRLRSGNQGGVMYR